MIITMRWKCECAGKLEANNKDDIDDSIIYIQSSFGSRINRIGRPSYLASLDKNVRVLVVF